MAFVTPHHDFERPTTHAADRKRTRAGKSRFGRCLLNVNFVFELRLSKLLVEVTDRLTHCGFHEITTWPDGAMVTG
jgi:hypothetical protein